MRQLRQKKREEGRKLFGGSKSVEEVEESTDTTEKGTTQLKLSVCQYGEQSMLELVKPNVDGAANGDSSCEKNNDIKWATVTQEQHMNKKKINEINEEL